MSNSKPVVGQKLFIVRSGRSTKFSKQYEEVVKVGRKYFWVIDAGRWENKLTIENMSSQSSAFPVRAYPSEKEYDNEIEARHWEGVFRNAFTCFNSKKYTLEQYREAALIFGLEPRKKGGSDAA